MAGGMCDACLERLHRRMADEGRVAVSLPGSWTRRLRLCWIFGLLDPTPLEQLEIDFAARMVARDRGRAPTVAGRLLVEYLAEWAALQGRVDTTAALAGLDAAVDCVLQQAAG